MTTAVRLALVTDFFTASRRSVSARNTTPLLSSTNSDQKSGKTWNYPKQTAKRQHARRNKVADFAEFHL
jgi:hypothetical protein